MRKVNRELSIDKIDKSDSRLIGGRPAWIGKAAEAAQRYPENMIPCRELAGLQDAGGDITRADERLMNNPTADPYAATAAAIAARKPTVLASMVGGGR